MILVIRSIRIRIHYCKLKSGISDIKSLNKTKEEITIDKEFID